MITLYFKESQIIENLDKLVVRSIKIIRVKVLDIEEKESNFKDFSVRVARSAKPRSIQISIDKDSTLDQTRQVIKSKKMRESVLLSIKSIRLDRYSRNVYIQSINKDEIEESQCTT